jgi:hypothetical protein
MRVARLLVACLAFVLAFVLAPPVPAVPGVFDDVVLVAATRFAAEAPYATEETSPSASRVLSRPTPTTPDVWSDDARPLAQLQSPRALSSRKYLRHCSLLC